MKYFTAIFVLFVFTLSCSKEQHNTHIKGDILGLKKGTVYLERFNDTSLVVVDSIVLNGASDFTFSLDLESPEMIYLFLRKTEGNRIKDGLEIFAAPGTIEVKTDLDDFENNVQVTGSVNHNKLVEHRKLMQRYTFKGLDYFKEKFDAERAGDSERLHEINLQYEMLIRSKYMATVNFALNNKDHEIAPFLALNEIYDTHVKYLDTIYTSLTPGIKLSLYGKELENYIKERKEQEQAE